MEIISSSIHKPALSAGLPEEEKKMNLVCYFLLIDE
jgi:hypothetical protein